MEPPRKRVCCTAVAVTLSFSMDAAMGYDRFPGDFRHDIELAIRILTELEDLKAEIEAVAPR
jgi:hypothetical protein